MYENGTIRQADIKRKLGIAQGEISLLLSISGVKPVGRVGRSVVYDVDEVKNVLREFLKGRLELAQKNALAKQNDIMKKMDIVERLGEDDA